MPVSGGPSSLLGADVKTILAPSKTNPQVTKKTANHKLIYAFVWPGPPLNCVVFVLYWFSVVAFLGGFLCGSRRDGRFSIVRAPRHSVLGEHSSSEIFSQFDSFALHQAPRSCTCQLQKCPLCRDTTEAHARRQSSGRNTLPQARHVEITSCTRWVMRRRFEGSR